MTIASPAAAADVPARWLLLLLSCMPMICPGDAMLLPGEWKLAGHEPQWCNWLKAARSAQYRIDEPGTLEGLIADKEPHKPRSRVGARY
jgi:hypothetical protein